MAVNRNGGGKDKFWKIKKTSRLNCSWDCYKSNLPMTKSIKDYIKRPKLKVLPWLSQSPDLNNIKNLWIYLKRTVHARRPKNLTELEAFCG